VSKRDLLGLTPDLTTRWVRGNDNFVCSSLWDFKGSFTCRKILRHGTFPLYFPSERKVCCGFVSPLKNPSPWPGSNPPGSSGSIVSDYGLDDRAIGVRSPAGAKDFSFILCVQTGSGVHPASCTVGTGGPLPRG
jgi:hypothetical protein